MKRIHFLVLPLIVLIAAQLASCTTSASPGGSGTGPNPPSGPSGVKHMYVSSIANASTGTIFIYQLPVTNASTPVGSATMLSGPMMLYVDSAGRLFVPFIGTNLIWVYKTPLTSASTPSFILTTIGQNPMSVTEDSSGNVYAGLSDANCCIDVFNGPVNGAATANIEVTGTGGPPSLAYIYGIASDSSNHVFAASQSSVIQMNHPITSASTPAVNLLTGRLGGLQGLVLDSSNNVYVANFTVGGTIDVFHQPLTAGSTRAFGIHVSNFYVQSLAFDPSGNLWATDPGNNVWEIQSPITAASVPQLILTNVAGAYGIAFGP